MAFFIMALVYLVGTVLYEVLRPKPKFDSPAPGYSGPFRTVIPIHSGQAFRSIPDSDSGPFRTTGKPV
jgi:hypothetical protein